MYPAPPAILPTNTSHKEILSAQLYEFKNWIYWKVQSWKYMIESEENIHCLRNNWNLLVENIMLQSSDDLFLK